MAAQRHGIEDCEIRVIADAHRHVGNSPARIVEYIRRSITLPNDPLYMLYHGRDAGKLAKRVSRIMKKYNIG